MKRCVGILIALFGVHYWVNQCNDPAPWHEPSYSWDERIISFHLSCFYATEVRAAGSGLWAAGGVTLAGGLILAYRLPIGLWIAAAGLAAPAVVCHLHILFCAFPSVPEIDAYSVLIRCPDLWMPGVACVALIIFRRRILAPA